MRSLSEEYAGGGAGLYWVFGEAENVLGGDAEEVAEVNVLLGLVDLQGNAILADDGNQLINPFNDFNVEEHINVYPENVLDNLLENFNVGDEYPNGNVDLHDGNDEENELEDFVDLGLFEINWPNPVEHIPAPDPSAPTNFDEASILVDAEGKCLHCLKMGIEKKLGDDQDAIDIHFMLVHMLCDSER